MNGVLSLGGVRALCFAIVTFLTIAVQEEASAQRRLIQRVTGNCPGGQCQPPILPQVNWSYAPEAIGEMKSVVQQPAQEVAAGAKMTASQWYQILVGPGRKPTTVEEETVRSFAKRAARILNGNSCGSGNLCGRDDSFIYILTNAHVAGTKIGHVVRCQALNSGGTVEEFPGTVVEAAYSSRTRTDWALLRADAKFMAGLTPIQLSKEKPSPESITGTWGCPRCEVPRGQVVQTVRFGSVWLWQPNSIGGQSGSAVVQSGKQYGLLTWSEGGNGSGQFTSTIYEQSVGQNTDGPARTGAEVPVTTVNGVELREGYHKEETGLGEYPIWADSGEGPPPTDPTDPNCPKVDDDTKRLLGIRDRLKQRGYDWAAIVMLIIQLIELLSKK